MTWSAVSASVMSSRSRHLTHRGCASKRAWRRLSHRASLYQLAHGRLGLAMTPRYGQCGEVRTPGAGRAPIALKQKRLGAQRRTRHQHTTTSRTIAMSREEARQGNGDKNEDGHTRKSTCIGRVASALALRLIAYGGNHHWSAASSSARKQPGTNPNLLGSRRLAG